MIAASTVDPTFFSAFAVGFVSFVSPCVLPLVPGYLSAVSGVTPNEMKAGEKVLLPAAIFCLSFTVVFVALGMTATGLGETLTDNRGTIETVAGVMIVALGVLFLITPFIPRLNRDFRVDALMRRAGAGGPLVAGAAFAIAWTPCVGPTLGAILSFAATKSNVDQGGLLLAAYSAGLAIPFLITAVAFNKATTVFRWLRDHYLIITGISGAVLIAMGILLLTGNLTWLNTQARDLLDALGIGGIYDL